MPVVFHKWACAVPSGCMFVSDATTTLNYLSPYVKHSPQLRYPSQVCILGWKNSISRWRRALPTNWVPAKRLHFPPTGSTPHKWGTRCKVSFWLEKRASYGSRGHSPQIGYPLKGCIFHLREALPTTGQMGNTPFFSSRGDAAPRTPRSGGRPSVSTLFCFTFFGGHFFDIVFFQLF